MFKLNKAGMCLDILYFTQNVYRYYNWLEKTAQIPISAFGLATTGAVTYFYASKIICTNAKSKMLQ